MLHLLNVLETYHFGRNGEILWKNTNLQNTLHTQGEEYILKLLFSDVIDKPSYYYFGLDNRTTIAVGDELADLSGEPTANGYARQAKNSTTDWTFTTISGYWVAKSAVITFSATSGIGWGPIKNLFLTMQDADVLATSGYLISSVDLGQTISVISGESISLRMVAGLKWCP
jgi:hypothetical protein